MRKEIMRRKMSNKQIVKAFDIVRKLGSKD